jgi:hypothetical protein
LRRRPTTPKPDEQQQVQDTNKYTPESNKTERSALNRHLSDSNIPSKSSSRPSSRQKSPVAQQTPVSYTMQVPQDTLEVYHRRANQNNNNNNNNNNGGKKSMFDSLIDYLIGPDEQYTIHQQDIRNTPSNNNANKKEVETEQGKDNEDTLTSSIQDKDENRSNKEAVVEEKEEDAIGKEGKEEVEEDDE